MFYNRGCGRTGCCVMAEPDKHFDTLAVCVMGLVALPALRPCPVSWAAIFDLQCECLASNVVVVDDAVALFNGELVARGAEGPQRYLMYVPTNDSRAFVSGSGIGSERAVVERD